MPYQYVDNWLATIQDAAGITSGATSMLVTDTLGALLSAASTTYPFPLTIAAASAQYINVNETASYWDAAQRQKKKAIVLMRGESLPYTLTARNGSSSIDLTPTNVFVVWRINGSGDDYTNTYLVSTGTVINATNGTVSFLLSPRDTNLRPGYYNGYIDAWQAEGQTVTRKGTLQTQTIDIRYSPYLNDTNYLAPLPFGRFVAEVTNAVCLGGPYYPDFFTMALHPWDYGVISTGPTIQANSIYVYNKIIKGAQGYLLWPQNIRVSDPTNEITYLNGTYIDVITAITTNYRPTGYFNAVKTNDAVQWHTNTPTGATGTFYATLGNYTCTISPIYGGTEEYKTNWYYAGDVPGSLRSFINTSMLARIAVTGLQMNVYLTNSWTRNASTNTWFHGIDLSSASPWNSKFGTRAAGTLITPQHYVRAGHYPFLRGMIGEQLLFIDRTNGMHYRTVIDERCLDPDCEWMNADGAIGLLDSPLPTNSIMPASILSSSDLGRFKGKTSLAGYGPTYTLWLNQHEQASAGKAILDIYDLDSRIGVPCGDLYEEVEYSAKIINGDSGNPIYLIVGEQVLLYSVIQSTMGGVALHNFATLIDALISDMGGSVYTNAWRADLSAWRDYNLPPPLQ